MLLVSFNLSFEPFPVFLLAGVFIERVLLFVQFECRADGTKRDLNCASTDLSTVAGMTFPDPLSKRGNVGDVSLVVPVLHMGSM